jgi:hypothetical protein
MMVDKVIGLFLALVFLTALAVVVSKRSDTAKVLTAFLKGFSDNLKAAASPIR